MFILLVFNRNDLRKCDMIANETNFHKKPTDKEVYNSWSRYGLRQRTRLIPYSKLCGVYSPYQERLKPEVITIKMACINS